MSAYENVYPSYDTVKCCKSHFKTGSSSVKDAPTSVRPSIVAEARNVARVLASDVYITVKEIMSKLELSHGIIFKILHEQVTASQNGDRWVKR